MRFHFTYSKDNISLLFQGKMHGIPKSHPSFEDIREHLKQTSHDAEVLRDFLDVAKSVARLTGGAVKVVGDVVYHGGIPIQTTLTNKLLDMLGEGFDAMPWALFLNGLMMNPSYRSRQCLFDFLEAGESPITEDGCFIAFKMVRDDFTDVHSGKFDNRPGAVVAMPRSQVNDDPNVTCAAGLHVCSLAYFESGFGGSNKRFLCVKVHPADVVAVPYDYHRSKLRCCRYEVIGEVDKIGDDAVEIASRPFINTDNAIDPALSFFPPSDEVEIELIEEAEDPTDFNRMWEVDNINPPRHTDYVVMTTTGYNRYEQNETVADYVPADLLMVGAVVAQRPVVWDTTLDPYTDFSGASPQIPGMLLDVLWQDGNLSDGLFVPTDLDVGADVVRVNPRSISIFQFSMDADAFAEYDVDSDDAYAADEEEDDGVETFMFSSRAPFKPVIVTPVSQGNLSPTGDLSFRNSEGVQFYAEQIVMFHAIYGLQNASQVSGTTPEQYTIWYEESKKHIAGEL